MSALPTWLRNKREQRQQRFLQSSGDARRYGITIRFKPLLKPTSEWMPGDHTSEQIITLESEGAKVNNLFDELNNPLVQEHLLSTNPAERTMLEDYAEGYADMGLLIIAPEGENTVDLTRSITSETFTEYILVIAQENSNLTIIDKITTQGTKLRTQVVEVIAQKNANVRYATINADNQDTNAIITQRAKVQDSASVDWFNANLGANKVRQSTDSYLEGENARAFPYGVFLGTQEEQFDIAAGSYHKGNQSSSDMYTRGVLGGKAQTAFRGMLDIDAQAFGCDGYQTEEVILISDDAIANAIPNLQIRNNDVKCSHGANIGRVEEEQLFYLTSRGIGKEDAIKMIVHGYFEPVAAKLEWPELFEMIEPLVHEKL